MSQNLNSAQCSCRDRVFTDKCLFHVVGLNDRGAIVLRHEQRALKNTGESH